MIYIRKSKLYTRLYNKPTDRHMYFNFSSEHPMSLKKFNNLLTFSQTQENTHWVSIPARSTITHVSLLLVVFITTYSRANPIFLETYPKHIQYWSYLGRSSATRELGKQEFMITHRKPLCLKDMLVRVWIPHPTTPSSKGCNRPCTCKYHGRIYQSGHIRNLQNSKTYNTLRNGTCQSNNLIYCLECNWCHIKYVGQTKNRIIDRFQGHIFYIRHTNSTTVARHFHSHNDQLDPKVTIHILEYVKLPRDIPRSN